MISAIDIKKLWHTETSSITADLTPSALKTLLSGDSVVEITNIHQDTWQIEEAEATQDSYRNQLNGLVYRKGKKQMGDLTVNFTIGQYDYATKQALMGGTLITTGSGSSQTTVGWKRSSDATNVEKCLIALTSDDVYVVLPKTSISTREGSTDGAIGLATLGTMLTPDNTAIAPEYWFDKSAVDAAV